MHSWPLTRYTSVILGLQTTEDTRELSTCYIRNIAKEPGAEEKGNRGKKIKEVKAIVKTEKESKAII